jgi:hypothetical protein
MSKICWSMNLKSSAIGSSTNHNSSRWLKKNNLVTLAIGNIYLIQRATNSTKNKKPSFGNITLSTLRKIRSQWWTGSLTKLWSSKNLKSAHRSLNILIDLNMPTKNRMNSKRNIQMMVKSIIIHSTRSWRETTTSGKSSTSKRDLEEASRPIPLRKTKLSRIENSQWSWKRSRPCRSTRNNTKT